LLPEFLTGPEWLAVFEEYGYCPDIGADPDDAWLHNMYKSLNGPPHGFWFGATEFAVIEVALIVEYMCEHHFFDEDELWRAIRVVSG
jgi:hypothetical protein